MGIPHSRPRRSVSVTLLTGVCAILAIISLVTGLYGCETTKIVSLCTGVLSILGSWAMTMGVSLNPLAVLNHKRGRLMEDCDLESASIHSPTTDSPSQSVYSIATAHTPARYVSTLAESLEGAALRFRGLPRLYSAASYPSRIWEIEDGTVSNSTPPRRGPLLPLDRFEGSVSVFVTRVVTVTVESSAIDDADGEVFESLSPPSILAPRGRVFHAI